MVLDKINKVIYITHIYSGEKDKCSALVTRNNKKDSQQKNTHSMFLMVVLKNFV